MKALRNTAIIILVIGVAFMVISLCYLNAHGIVLAKNDDTPDMNVTGNIGDFIGGMVGTILSISSTIFIIATIQLQSTQNQRQDFIQNFFEMLHVHCGNVDALQISTPIDKIRGRYVFSKLVSEYNHTFDIVHGFLNGRKKNLSSSDLHYDEIIGLLSDEQRLACFEMRLVYGYFFYGSKAFTLHSKDPAEKELEKYSMNMLKQCGLFVEAHNILLGHYYRHMFHIMTFIAGTDCINEKKKYYYAKQLRAQLNDDEQILLYYNAMSDVGEKWITNNKESNINTDKKVCDMKFRKYREALSLLARFRMIKNISSDDIRGLSPTKKFSKEIEIYRNQGLDFFEHE